MARCVMSEEKITKTLMSWLSGKGWTIVSYDFPQSGTGILIHPDFSHERNRGAIIPDIIAIKKGICVFFENKDHFSRSDFNKINQLITANQYVNNISRILAPYSIRSIYYGIALPKYVSVNRIIKHKHLVDFVLQVDDECHISEIHNAHNIEF